MRGFKICILLALAVATSTAYSQLLDTTEMKPGQLKRFGISALESGDIFTAVDYLSVYHRKRPEDSKVAYQLAELYFKERNYPKAAEMYHAAFREDRFKLPDAQFKYAKCLKMQGKYEKALNEFRVFERYIRYLQGKEFRKYKDLLETERYGCLMAIEDTTNANVVVKVLPGNVNHAHIDFCPIALTEQQLIYGSLAVEELKYYEPAKDSMPMRKFYHAIKRKSGWEYLGEYEDGPFNKADEHSGNGAFSPNQKRFYFTRCKRHLDNRILCRIYLSKKENNLWTKPKVMNEDINPSFNTSTMPAVGLSRRNTDVLYFVSGRPGGEGGMDIWYSEYSARRDKYKKPRNCGRRINTEGHEESPYYDVATKSMYFSSNGHPGLGGLDVFRARGSSRKWDHPVNVGEPINSSVDDLYYTLAPSRRRGYFVSNREGGHSLRHSTCCDDIYEFTNRDYVKIDLIGKIYGITDFEFFKKIEAQYKNNLTVHDIDANQNVNSMKLLHKHPVSLYMINPQTKKEMFIKTDSTQEGNYHFDLEQGIDYILKVKDFNRKLKSYTLTTKPIKESDTIVMDAIIVNTVPTEPLILKNVYYKFGKATLTSQARTTIDETIFKLLQEHPNLKVEISSHTDSVSSDEFNNKLSEARAQSVVDYLLKKGIPPQQMSAKGYGETMPIAPNSNPDGSDNPEGRAKNRRTEFRIIGEVDEYSEIIYEE